MRFGLSSLLAGVSQVVEYATGEVGFSQNREGTSGKGAMPSFCSDVVHLGTVVQPRGVIFSMLVRSLVSFGVIVGYFCFPSQI